MSENNNILLSVRNLTTHFHTEQGLVKAVQDVSFDILAGKTLAVVGESGCGKSVTALSIMRLIPWPPGRIVEGRIVFKGESLLDAAESRMRQIRGNDIAMIFQEPMTSLNPVFTVGNQIVEAVRLHQKKSGSEAWDIAVDMMRKVGIADPQRRVREYPHQMSGGMRQRVMIAMALCCWPSLLIADEPTTALDVTIQAQILDLLRRMRQESGMSIMLITHDLGVVAENADDIVVMYASRVVETACAKELFEKPLHPYTQGLLRSLPRLGARKHRLDVIGGAVPNPLHFPAGCKFHPRCPVGCKDTRCRTAEPPLREVSPGRCAACWYAEGYDSSFKGRNST
ncbi:MAG TPA: ABC transporter ATP-binding protein [Anaerohalosphaeraceae bacterium]|nr:ABC transporter ATP-binding protein [Phycisphaerae bacterium]HOK96623.1 ABC transporter ATP-binding protein [Anaerohalosphaeraceae bacterium]HOL31707.1 ABC transporter ATP-binding protein [Anaerohalosphaeraceae bacterium]HOM76382.1 ABC transporter ATP-binding protein [Anaerohalosphaeraceae bacterium]HPC64863.1 ABC transporter ATP-binding protein [Anaerohalosphaeraceae bacterium]